ncbi:MAG: acetyl-CoA carboxylase carboxyltransferase subunit alpha [Oscillospiraceae bacterium]|jgi:acetyl-CoA carboxylase carboxyl transferase subunit alpha|nr:acetyl-CoA carboxylase carboxyltransferase subunit alpha [Oscillospiraceae bacterium]
MSNITAAARLEIIRHKNRPTVNDYIPLIFRNFTELHGDRLYGDDPAIKGGVAFFRDTPVTVIAQVKGRSLSENKAVNFGMPHPEGYRKAMRLAKQAEKFGRPVIALADTPGAFCGIAAEERGQGEAIARCLFEFSTLKTPIISIILGEGGSGGALALCMGDELAMLENALYSVISPRGFASILWKDPKKEALAADTLKITAEDMVSFGVAESIIPEPSGGAHNDLAATVAYITEYLEEAIPRLVVTDTDELLKKRTAKFREKF